jgi:hypothetical protein
MYYLLRVCGYLFLLSTLAHASWAQQGWLFNPDATWRTALHVAGEPLVLPAAQCGIRVWQTYAEVQGQQCLLQRRHFDQHGRLDTVSYYMVEARAGHLASFLSHQTVYHTLLQGDSLMSQVYRLSPFGSIPPVEPLLGQAAAAHQVLLPPGSLRELSQQPGLDAGAQWQWGVAGGSGQWTLHFQQNIGPQVTVRTATLDRQARTLVVTGDARFTRAYLDSSQDYEERSFPWARGTGGGSTIEWEGYVRRVHYAKGLCRSEQFTVPVYFVAGEKATVEFEVRHLYTFYTSRRARHFRL